MKILILVSSFPPEIRSASHLFFELAESLVESNNEVTVITRMPLFNIAENKKPDEKYKKLLMRENVKGIKVLRVASIPVARSRPLARAFDEFYLGFIFFLRSLFIPKQDGVLVYSPPLPLGLAAYFLKLIKRSNFILNVQDLYPQTAIDLKLIRNPFLIKLAVSFEKFIYKRARYITVHSDGNRKYVIKKGISENKVKVIPNWVDTELINVKEKENDFRKQQGLDNNFLITFAGVIGFAQDLEVVIKSAKLLENHGDIKFLMIGEGPAKEMLIKKAEELGLINLRFLPMQSRETYPQILAASDICLVTLKGELKTPVVPGKTMSIMAAGRPIVASIPFESDAKEIIENARSGIVVKAGDVAGFNKAILELYENKKKREIMGANARLYAEQNFSRKMCVSRYQELFFSMK